MTKPVSVAIPADTGIATVDASVGPHNPALPGLVHQFQVLGIPEGQPWNVYGTPRSGEPDLLTTDPKLNGETFLADLGRFESFSIETATWEGDDAVVWADWWLGKGA